jgi:integrase
MYATGTRVSQALRLKGIDVFADPITGAHSIRLPKAKRGHSRSYRVIQSADPVRDLSPIVDLARQREVPSYLGLTRHHLHVVVKKYARLAGLHEEMVHCHTVRHSWEKMQRPGAITGYLCHTSSVYQYLRENDATLGEDAMAAVSTA